jgi:hypothetical protein
MADAGMRDLHQDFTLAGRFDVDLDDLQGLSCRESDCRA